MRPNTCNYAERWPLVYESASWGWLCSGDMMADQVGLGLPQYSGKENTSMEGTIEASIDKLVQLIEGYVSGPGEYRLMELGMKIQYFTLDVISDLAFGEPFGHLDKDADVYSYIDATATFFPVMHTLANIPSIVTFLQTPFMSWAQPSEKDKTGWGAFIGYVPAPRAVLQPCKLRAPGSNCCVVGRH